MRQLKNLLFATEDEARKIITDTLQQCKIPYVIKKDYIFTDLSGNRPLVCIHTDTVSPVPPVSLEINGSIVSLPKNSPAGCLGADDRAGIWIALELIKLGFCDRFHFAFFAGEEKGCLGSRHFSFVENLEQYTCFIGLDRASRGGKQNTATYGYDNDDLTKLSPFPVAMGSFSDCSVLAEETGLACINLSVGYQFEHSRKELLDVELMKETLEVMKSFPLISEPIEAETVSYSWNSADLWETDEMPGMPVLCEDCGEHDLLYEVNGFMLCGNCAMAQADRELKLNF